MDELLIDGINWLDSRMIGVKCWFKHSTSDWTLGYLHKVVADTPPSTFASRMPNSEYVEWYPHCRIAQGEKTSYKGTRQPVADGIIIKCWFADDSCDTYYSQILPWEKEGEITYYQIQER